LVPPEPLQAIGRGLEPSHCLVRVFEIESVFATPMREAIDAHELLGEDIVQHHVPQAPAA
jgi:hypothetical protein